MIYKPSDDTYLIAESIEHYVKDKTVIDMGTGSGYLAESALRLGARAVTAVDINDESIINLKSKNLKLNILKSDLFENVQGKFDIIIFNPPYLPKDKDEDKESQIATTGGKKGDEIIVRFLKQAKKHMEENGIILLLTSSLTPMENIKKTLKNLKLISEQISSKKVFFESLHVYKIKKQ